jgi:hypothetical protein
MCTIVRCESFFFSADSTACSSWIISCTPGARLDLDLDDIFADIARSYGSVTGHCGVSARTFLPAVGRQGGRQQGQKNTGTR